MKKLIVSCVALLLIAAAPAPKGFVNDFANIIPDEREVGIEGTLRNYEAKTSIEIAVITTPSLEGKVIEDYAHSLFQQWGVGKRGANNGILVVIAPNEREYRVEVGSGLEGDLTDADTSIIARESLVTAFKASDYAGGVENLTQTLIRHLGDMTPDQRAIFHRKMQEAADRKAAESRAKLFDFLGSVFVVFLSGVVLLLVVLAVRNVLNRLRIRKRNALRRKTLREQLTTLQSKLARLVEERSSIDLPSLPAWMQDDKEEHGGSFGKALEMAFAARKKAEDLIEVSLDSAEELRNEVGEHLKEAERSLELLRTIPDQVRTYRHATEQVVGEACTTIDALVARAALLTKERYRVTVIVPALDLPRLAQEKESIQEQFALRGEGPKDASEIVHDKATRLLARVQSLQEALDNGVQMRTESDRRIKELKKRVQNFPTLLEEHRARLTRLQQRTPSKRWSSLVENLPMFERTLAGIAPRLEVAARANSMDAQLFSDAAATLVVTEKALGIIDDSVKAAVDLESAVVRAEKEYPVKHRATQDALSTASHFMNKSDVGSGAKGRLAEARRLLESIRTDGSSTDWIGAIYLLEQAAAKAGQASQLARNDIESAARERQRRKDEQDRRERLAREASYASTQTRSNNSPGDSSFSFGGGGSSGGGASGSW